MTTGSFSTPVSEGSWLKLFWTQESFPQENRSQVTAQVYLALEEGFSMTLSAQPYGSTISIGDASYSFAVPALAADGPGEYLLGQASRSVPHLSDGTCTLSLSAVCRLAAAELGAAVSAFSLSEEITLSPLGSPSRLTSYPSQVSLDGETPLTAAVSRSNPSFFHILTVSLEDFSISSDPFETKTSLLIPQEWLRAFPASVSCTATLRLTTYSGEDCAFPIGEPHIAALTLRCPESVSPKVREGWCTLSPVVKEGTNLPGDFSAFAQDVTFLRAVFDPSLVDDSGLFGATIQRYLLVCDGHTAWGTDSTVGPLSASGTMTVRISAVDSRGRSHLEIREIPVLPYAAPALTQSSIYRCDESGASQEDGAFLRFYALPVISALDGFNAAALSARLRPVGGAWSEYTPMTAAAPLILPGADDPESSYEGEILLTDSAGGSSVFTCVVSSSAVTVHLRQGGKAVGIGKYAESEEVVDSAWPVYAPALHAEGEVSCTSLSLPLSSLWQTLTVTRSSSGVTSLTAAARYSPLLGIVVLSGSCVLSAAIASGSTRVIGTLSAKGPLGTAILPFSCTGANAVRGYVSSMRQIMLTGAGAIVPANTTLYFSAVYYAG